MKTIIKMIFIASLLATLSFSGDVCLKVVELMDKKVLSSDYQKIAFYTYRHKMKLDYLMKNYKLLAKTRNSNSSDMETHAGISENIVSVPTVQMASAEADVIAATNTVNIALLDLLLYKSIKEEIAQAKKK